MTDDTNALALREAEQEFALTTRVEQSIIERLEGMAEATAIFERRAELLTVCHAAAIKRTRPDDWVINKDRDGNAIAMLRGSGADLIAELYGVCIERIYPLDARGQFAPERVSRQTGTAYGYRCWFDAFSRFNGRAVHAVECTRWSDEDFTGRKIDGAGALVRRPGDDATTLDSDLRAAVQRLAMTKAVRILCGMSRVPLSELETAWKGTAKSTGQAASGHGGGSAAERTATKVAEVGIEEAREKLGDELLRRVGGDKAAAAALLKECTASDTFKGWDTIARITQKWQVEAAWKKLRAHDMFGDAQQNAGE